MAPRLFFYGTLRDGDLRKTVTGRRIEVARAWLKGFRCVPVVGRSYPMLTECSGKMVEGVLTGPVDAHALKRLIAYEGGRVPP